jgi:hypothetical protein
MVNYCRNILTYEPEMHDQVLSTVSGDNGAIDFYSIIPTPSRQYGASKYNARAIQESPGRIEFSTLKIKPSAIFIRISELLPDIEFTVLWARDLLNDNGRMIVKAGEVSSYEEDYTEQFARSVWSSCKYGQAKG